MERVARVEDRRRPILQIIVHERPATFHRVFHVGQRRSRTGPLVVTAEDFESVTVALWHDDAGRPYLDIEFDRLAGRQRPQFIMRMIGPIGSASFRIKLAV